MHALGNTGQAVSRRNSQDSHSGFSFQWVSAAQTTGSKIMTYYSLQDHYGYIFAHLRGDLSGLGVETCSLGGLLYPLGGACARNPPSMNTPKPSAARSYMVNSPSVTTLPDAPIGQLFSHRSKELSTKHKHARDEVISMSCSTVVVVTVTIRPPVDEIFNASCQAPDEL